MSRIRVESIEYHGIPESGYRDYNATVIYRKYKKLYVVNVWVDFHSAELRTAKTQTNGGKSLKGAMEAINDFALRTRLVVKKQNS